MDCPPLRSVFGREPGAVVLRRGQQQFVELAPTEDHRNMLFRVCPKLGDNQSGFSSPPLVRYPQ